MAFFAFILIPWFLFWTTCYSRLNLRNLAFWVASCSCLASYLSKILISFLIRLTFLFNSFFPGKALSLSSLHLLAIFSLLVAIYQFPYNCHIIYKKNDGAYLSILCWIKLILRACSCIAQTNASNCIYRFEFLNHFYASSMPIISSMLQANWQNIMLGCRLYIFREKQKCYDSSCWITIQLLADDVEVTLKKFK